MKDVIGQELQIDDEVVFVSSPGGRRHLVKGFVTAINGKTVSIGREKAARYCGWAYPNQLVKIPQGVPEGQVTVSNTTLISYRKAYYQLADLEAIGVDNWDGYQRLSFDDEGFPLEEEDEDD